jgi:hypothetical protein
MLAKETVIAEVKARLLEMSFNTPMGIKSPSGPGVDQLATAIGTSFFNVLTAQAQVQGTVQVDTISGTGEIVAGTGKIV